MDTPREEFKIINCDLTLLTSLPLQRYLAEKICKNNTRYRPIKKKKIGFQTTLGNCNKISVNQMHLLFAM